jgi:hypothetical protein
MDYKMTNKGKVIVGLAILVVALIIGIILANTTVVVGNAIIFNGEYELSDKQIVNIDPSVYGGRHPLTNGDVIVWFAPDPIASDLNTSIMYIDTRTNEMGTIWEHQDNDLQVLPVVADMKNDKFAFIVEDLVESGTYHYYCYDFASEELTYLFNTSEDDAPFFGVKIYENYVLWGCEISDVDTIYIHTISNGNDYVLMELREADGNYCKNYMDIFGNQAVVQIYNSTYGGDYLARANILNPRPDRINWVVEPTDYPDTNFNGVSLFDNMIATTFISPEYTTARVALVENITTEPNIRLIDPQNMLEEGFINIPYVYDHFVLWVKTDTSYEDEWVYMYDTSLNKTWRIDTATFDYDVADYIPQIHMQKGVICWGETSRFDYFAIYYMEIVGYSEEAVKPEFAASINFNGVYLLGITAALLVGIVATEWIAEGGLPSIRGKYQHVDIHRTEPPDYWER